MVKIKINLSGGEIMIEFKDMKDLEDQLEKIDLSRINSLLDAKKSDTMPQAEKSEKKDDVQNVSKSLNEFGTINLLKISENGQDAVKLAIFLATNGLSREEIKKITGITILSS